MLIYKIFRAPEWAVLQDQGRTDGAPIDIDDGFVHLSTGEQVAKTCALYFAQVEGLVLVALDTEQLGDELRWEESRGGALFPHLFRELRIGDVVWNKDLALVDGAHVFPDGVL